MTRRNEDDMYGFHADTTAEREGPGRETSKRRCRAPKAHVTGQPTPPPERKTSPPELETPLAPPELETPQAPPELVTPPPGPQPPPGASVRRHSNMPSSAKLPAPGLATAGRKVLAARKISNLAGAKTFINV